MVPSPSFALFPPEIVDHLLGFLPKDKRVYQRISLVEKVLCAPAQKYLFRSISLDTPDLESAEIKTPALDKFHILLLRSSHLAPYVETFKVTLDVLADSNLVSLVPSLRNVWHLKIRGGRDNFNWDSIHPRVLKAFRTHLFPQLHKLQFSHVEAIHFHFLHECPRLVFLDLCAVTLFDEYTQQHFLPASSLMAFIVSSKASLRFLAFFWPKGDRMRSVEPLLAISRPGLKYLDLGYWPYTVSSDSHSWATEPFELQLDRFPKLQTLKVSLKISTTWSSEFLLWLSSQLQTIRRPSKITTLHFRITSPAWLAARIPDSARGEWNAFDWALQHPRLSRLKTVASTTVVCEGDVDVSFEALQLAV
ncbi:hypothetical protein DL96DRAFT_1706646 [Flagelloscypha sp. PMI_526]|nr:hypothetical protein DL96DRAFT_1706646 [Flagelloscypha sp. PMI_526]